MGVNLLTISYLSLILILAKEILSYESEKFTILCITFFIITSYILFSNSLYEVITQKIIVLKHEFNELTLLYKNYLKEIIIYKESNEKVNQIVNYLTLWLKYNLISLSYKAYFNKIHFILLGLRDHIVSLYKSKYKVKQLFITSLIKQTFINLKIALTRQIENQNIKIEKLLYYLNKIIVKSKKVSVINLILFNLNKYQNFSNYITFLDIKNKKF